MKEEDIKQLLEKYYEGNSSLQEEMLLKEFFSNNTLEGYESEKEIFRHYSGLNNFDEPDAGFENRIMQRIEASDESRGRIRRFLLPLAGAAASLIIIGGTWFFLNSRARTVDTFSDPAIAYAETMKILYNVSVKMNRGAEALQPVTRLGEATHKSIDAINESSAKIDKNLRILSKDYGKENESEKTK